MYFEITGSPVRLLGSMHQWPVEVGVAQLPHWVMDAYEWCEELYLEADPTDAAQFMRLTDGSTLESRLPPATWAALKFVLPTGIDVSGLTRPRGFDPDSEPDGAAG